MSDGYKSESPRGPARKPLGGADQYSRDASVVGGVSCVVHDHEFDGWALVRQGRLSTMSAPEAFWEWLAKQGAF